jgi:hypothetical protein
MSLNDKIIIFIFNMFKFGYEAILKNDPSILHLLIKN